MIRGSVAIAGVVALAAAVAVVLVGGLGPSDQQAEIAASCQAVQDGRWSDALAYETSLVSPDPDGRVAAECRCWALLATQQREACGEVLRRAMGDPTQTAWVPEPVFAKLLLRGWRDRGQLREAAAFARRAGPTYPDDADLLQLEVMSRMAVEPAEEVVSDLEVRLADTPDATHLRLVLAGTHLRTSDHARALAALGETPPADDDAYLGLWFIQRIRALAATGRLDAVVGSFALWREHGGNDAELQARYAIELSLAHLYDPRHSHLELLRAATARQAEIRDEQVVASLYQRLLGHLIADEDFEGALAAYDEAGARLEAGLEEYSREGLERRISLRDGGDATGTAGTLVFRIPDAPPGATLHVSPDVDGAVDDDYQTLAVSAGQPARIERALAPTPTRWVLRDANRRTLASGAAWPALDAEAELEIAIRAPESSVRRFEPPRSRRAGDGHRRVFTLILDCADWRLTQYLRARGELPVHDWLFREGYRAVLTSRPALTAAAMESLVWPERRQQVSYAGLLHRMGLELAGLSSVGRNPLGFLAAILPESQSLFEALGAGDRVAVNMLFSHGGIEAGRHAEMIGPHGRHRLATLPDAYRTLSPEERTRMPFLADAGTSRVHVETIAAEFDAAVAYAHGDETDLLMLRIEPLDLLTHEFFHLLTATAQDDGDSPLLSVYRYIDDRLGELVGALDEDDVLIVMSDHGIRTAMEHEEDALFVAVGAGVPRGRAPGSPDLRGVPQTLAGLFGLQTRWPDTGIHPWPAESPSIAATTPR